MIIVFDIDHVLADSRHRDHYIHPIDGSLRNWPAYYDLLPEDPVVLPIYNIVTALANTGSHDMYLCTGRHEHMRDMTEQWFRDYGVYKHFTEMMMRKPDAAHWTNADIKERMAMTFKKGIDLVFEDNPKSVAMWQRYAKIVCEVKYGQAA